MNLKDQKQGAETEYSSSTRKAVSQLSTLRFLRKQKRRQTETIHAMKSVARQQWYQRDRKASSVVRAQDSQENCWARSSPFFEISPRSVESVKRRSMACAISSTDSGSK